MPAPPRPLPSPTSTAGTPRRLPAVPLPGTRESLPSWINRIALAYQIRQQDTLESLGVSAAEIRKGAAGLALAPSAVEAISAATGVSPEEIGDILLSRFAATALPNLPLPPYKRPSALTGWSMGAWVLRRHSNFCPKCLARDGRWRLEWKLPWSFACLDHMVYLRETCPQCERVQSGLCWGWDSRVCQLRRPATQLEAPFPARIPHSGPGQAVVCRGRLDRAEVIRITDIRALKGQRRLLRWLYGTPEKSSREREFASLTALAAQRLTPGMLEGAQAELRDVRLFDDTDTDTGWPQAEPELSQMWAAPLRMAGAARVAQRLTTKDYHPARAAQWLVLKQPRSGARFARLADRGRQLSGTSLVYGPFHHPTEHMHEALRVGLVSLPRDGPAYISTLSTYRVPPTPRSMTGANTDQESR
ncbi:TniQ family protein [Streptomyces sp. NPDC088812]|uniref:TniQ family protein n=1 Tax=Streptomyces sp. NPDC088812 TaxID=3365905 RepID=UPI00380BBDF2